MGSGFNLNISKIGNLSEGIVKTGAKPIQINPDGSFEFKSPRGGIKLD